jgi:CMP-N-acetylneuraminic acid synthetase
MRPRRRDIESQSDRFSEYLAGKSVVVVGPAAYMEGLEQGPHIDSHDVVVRLNLDCPINPAIHERIFPGDIPRPNPADVGTRTDVLYHTLFNESLSRAAGQEHGDAQLEAWEEDGLQWLVCRMRNRRVDYIYPYTEGRAFGFVIPPRSWYLDFKDELGTPPNMGLVAIRHLLDAPIKSLHVTGMSFNQPWEGYRSGYGGFTREQASRGDGSGMWGQLGHTPPPHDQQSQMAYLRDLAYADHRLTFDDLPMRNLRIKEGRGITALVFMKGMSERLPGKNLRPLGGAPMYEWIIRALLSARRVKSITIGTEDAHIARQVRARFGERVTVVEHPPHLASETANALIAHHMTTDAHYGQFHATSPLLSSATIDEAITQYLDDVDLGLHDSLVSVTEHHSWFWDVSGAPIGHDPAVLVRSQDTPPVYQDNSGIHLFSRNSFMRNGSRVGLAPRLYPISKVEAVDIDDAKDFEIASGLMMLRNA